MYKTYISLEVRILLLAGVKTFCGCSAIGNTDYSSAGMPSMRIKTAADFEIGGEAEVFLSELRRQIRYLEIIPVKVALPRKPASLENVIRCNAYVAMAHQAEFVCDEKSRADYFEKTVSLGAAYFFPCQALTRCMLP
ncbi:MAG: hypothetical protein LBB68_11725 [Treponema sp.]|nr:hypothetical protein [Treponema sp.]